MNIKNFCDPSNSEDEAMLQNFSNHCPESDMFHELIKVESDLDFSHCLPRNSMEAEQQYNLGKDEEHKRRLKYHSKQKKKVFYRDKMAELMKDGEYNKPEYKYTANGQLECNGKLTKDEQLKRNRESAKNSRQRKKEYVSTIIKIVDDQKAIIEELSERLDQVTQERDRLRNTHQDEIKYFEKSKAEAYEALEEALKDEHASPLQTKAIVQDMNTRFGTAGTERMHVINYYMNEIIEVLSSDIHKYFINCSILSERYTSPNKERKGIDEEVIRILGMDTAKMQGMMARFQDRFIKEATVFKDLTQELYRTFKSIENKGKAIDIIFSDMMKEIEPRAMGELIHWFEEYRFLPDVKRVRTEWTKLLKTGEEDFEVMRKMKKE